MFTKNNLWPRRALTLVAVLLAVSAHAQPAITVSSPAFENGAAIPSEYTCSGQDKSPPLKWSGVPDSAKSLALIVEDPDAPSGTFTHWVLYNLPPGVKELPEGVEKNGSVGGGGTQGKNDFGRRGYGGPCPPPGAPHHYHFRLIALDTKLDLKSGSGASEVADAIKGHEIVSGELIGTFGR